MRRHPAVFPQHFEPFAWAGLSLTGIAVGLSFSSAFRAFRLGWIVTYRDRRRPKSFQRGRKRTQEGRCEPLGGPVRPSGLG